MFYNCLTQVDYQGSAIVRRLGGKASRQAGGSHVRGCMAAWSAMRGHKQCRGGGGMLILSSILHQNNRPNTSNLWLLTFFPFLFHTILGRGSPVAWHMKEATPPCTPVWSLGVLRNFGGAEETERERERENRTKGLERMVTITSRRCNFSSLIEAHSQGSWKYFSVCVCVCCLC